MLNNPPPERRKQHPLDRDPAPPPAPPPGQPQHQQVTLHIPSVRPTVTYAIIAINVAIFVVRALSPQLDNQIFLWGANHPSSVLVDGEIYRLLTSMFLHAGIFGQFGGYALENSLHIIFNMYILYYIGRQVERLFGHLRFSLIYLLGGLAGSVLSAVFSSADVYSIGASGAVFAVLSAQLVYLYQHRKLLGARVRPMIQSLAILAVVDLFIGVLSDAGGGMSIDNWAHLGGAVGGLVLAWFICPIFIVQRHPEIPNELIGEDINPLKNRYWAVSIYVIVLLVTLIVARILNV